MLWIIELEEAPTVLMLTDCYMAEFTMIDPYTDAIQIVGRFRNGVSAIYHIANTNHNLPIKSQEEIKGFIKCSEKIYNNMRTFYSSAPNRAAKEAYRAAWIVCHLAGCWIYTATRIALPLTTTWMRNC
mgnify:CR=1 FL=1